MNLLGTLPKDRVLIFEDTYMDIDDDTREMREAVEAWYAKHAYPLNRAERDALIAERFAFDAFTRRAPGVTPAFNPMKGLDALEYAERLSRYQMPNFTEAMEAVRLRSAWVMPFMSDTDEYDAILATNERATVQVWHNTLHPDGYFIEDTFEAVTELAKAAAIAKEAERLRTKDAAALIVAAESSAFGLFDARGVMTLDRLEDEEASAPLIEGVLSTGELSCISGPSYAGKTYLALDWAFCVATGTPWHGHAVTRGKVLYMRMEGANDFLDRIAALEAHYGVKADPDYFQVWGRTVSYLDPANAKAITEYVRANGVALVVTDTVNRAFAGGNENEPAAMGQFVMSATEIREATPRTTHVVIHHPPKDSDKATDLRGHGSLYGALDRVYALTVPGNASSPDRVLVNTKNKAGVLAEDRSLAFATEGASSVLIPGRSTTRPNAHGNVVAALRALGGSGVREAVKAQLIGSGACKSATAANTAIRNALKDGTLIEADGLLSLA